MGDRLEDLRDRALLLIGFAGGLRLRTHCSQLHGRWLSRASFSQSPGRRPTRRALGARSAFRTAERYTARSERSTIGSGRRRSRMAQSSARWTGIGASHPIGAAGEAVSLIVRDRMSVVGFDSLELFRPQLARRVRDQRHQSRRLHVQDQAADWARFRRHALALHSGWGTSSFGTPPEFFSRHCDGVLTCRHSGRGLRRQPPSSCVGGVADRQLRRRHQAHFAPLILQAKA
jgi:hypothetical protein